MQKTIFSRYIRITMMIVIIGFVMLGIVMMLFFSQYLRADKQKVLRRNAEAVVSFTERTYGYSKNTELEFSDMMNMLAVNITTNSEVNVLLTDAQGNVILSSYLEEEKDKNITAIDGAIIQKIAENDGLYEEQDTLGGVYTERHFSVGMPYYSGTEEGRVFAGVAIVSVSASPMSGFLKESLEIFLVASILVLIVCFFVVGFFSYSLVKPLRLMSEAVKSFGNGDFSVRVPVTTSDELGQLAASFNDMANSLSNSEGMRRSFIANVSHELKTPMTTIAGFIDGILDGTIPEKDKGKYLHIVSEEVKRLSRLVKSMLDLSRIDSGEMRIHPQNFDMTNIIFSTLLTFEKSINEKNIEVTGLEEAGHQTVYGDQDLLHQVMYNLIENAVKFTEPGGYISFAISDGIDRTSVAIENSGAGIDPEELSMIFDRFYKTDKSRSKDKNGMGLGLYIVRTIIQLHGGEISVSSQLRKFTRFEFYIPKKKPEITQKTKDGAARIRDGKTKDNSSVEVYDAQIIEENETTSQEESK